MRTRVVVSQSKGGCLTCKTRRVKCDEQRPLCRRCLRAGRLCDGYGEAPKLSSSSSSCKSVSAPSILALHPALRTGVRADGNTERLSHLAAHVLSLDTNGRPLSGDGVWGRVFLQLSNQVECVKAAAAAFGAAYEMCVSHNSADLSSSTWRHYGAALARVRVAFASGKTGLESIALASMILACAEILTQHEVNALSHFLGAVQIVHSAASHAPSKLPSTELASIKDELARVDILIFSYSLAQTPQMARFGEYGEGAAGRDDAFDEPHQATNAVMRCLYRARRFIDSAAKLRYNYPSWNPGDSAMCKAQSEAAAQCRAVLGGLAAITENLQAECVSGTAAAYMQESHETLADMYGLRTQVTATLVFILCLHDPSEQLYDDHGDLFQSIISDAAASSRLRRRARTGALKRFSTRPGVVSPLFLVSFKCRYPSMRALATAMLKEQGREGPSDGQIMAAVGGRVAALESSNADGPVDDAVSPQAQRIHGHGVFPERTDADGRRVIDIEYSRPNPPLAQGWGTLDYTSAKKNWDIWREPVEI